MAKTKEELVRELIRDGYLKSPLLIEAFRAVDRADFVPRELHGEAYGNYPLPIGHGQTISQPLTVAFMLELLDPRPGDTILEIGAGSGWVTALLAYVVSKPGESAGYIVAVERISELKEMAEENVGAYGFVEKGIAKIILGDGSNPSTLLGAGSGRKFYKIIAAASINPRESASYPRQSALEDLIPQSWKKQLKIGGRIVAPIGQSIVVLDKIRGDVLREKDYFGFSFVPLVRD